MSHQKTNIINKKVVQFFILILIIISISFVSYIEYKSTLKETTDKLNEKMINFHFETFSVLSKILLKDTNHNLIQEVIDNKDKRENFEDMLRLIRISTIQNLFVISRDSESNYYILLDSDNNPETKSDLFEPFNPLGDLWDQAYDYKTLAVFHHKKSKDLWVTIAYPIVENNKTIAIIGADISHNLDVRIQTNFRNFSSFFLWILFLGLFWFVFLYFLTFYFREKFYEGYLDPLTKVYNRKYLYEILIKKLSRNYQLFMLDIDFFKKINDNYGHDTGDYVLKEVAKRINVLIRDEDSFIRYGGEEFLIYSTKLTREKSIEFAERIRESIESEVIIYKKVECTVTISIGVNPLGTKDDSFEDVLKKADEALYLAKNEGRNCVRVVN